MPRKRSVAEIVEDARQIEELVAAGLPLADAVSPCPHPAQTNCGGSPTAALKPRGIIIAAGATP